MRENRRDFLFFKRIVVKVGSSSITKPDGELNLVQIEALVNQLAELLNKQEKELLLVTSGAIGAGLGRLNFSSRPKNIPELQAAAAVGQGILMHVYENFFAAHGITIGQVLLTREDFSDRKRFLNARNALNTLIQLGAVPVINENDAVAVEEIKFGDNDNLSALVASLVDANLLILLSDIDGLYTADPRCDPSARLITEIREITPAIEELAGGAGSKVGTGGMVTKLQAARVAMHSGVVTVISSAGEKNMLRRVFDGEEVGTVFWPSVNKLENKKRWIAYSSLLCGKIFVDEGAAQALIHHGKSLLPSGITGVEGVFSAGNTVSIIERGGREVARGIVNYTAEEVEKIKGRQTEEIICILGYKDYDEVVHRNNLVLNL